MYNQPCAEGKMTMFSERVGLHSAHANPLSPQRSNLLKQPNYRSKMNRKRIHDRLVLGPFGIGTAAERILSAEPVENAV